MKFVYVFTDLCVYCTCHCKFAECMTFINSCISVNLTLHQEMHLLCIQCNATVTYMEVTFTCTLRSHSYWYSNVFRMETNCILLNSKRCVESVLLSRICDRHTESLMYKAMNFNCVSQCAFWIFCHCLSDWEHT